LILKDKKVLVTGATGFIGGRVVEKLILDHKSHVRAIVRNLSNASRLGRFNLEIVNGDICNRDIVDKSAEDCELIIHCAYDFRESHKDTNFVATENIINTCLKNNIKMVHISSIDVYGWPSDGFIDETSPRVAKGNDYAKTKLRVENKIFDYIRKRDLKATIIQPTIVYGPYSRPWTITPINQLKTGKIVLVEGGLGYCNEVYVDDVVDAILLASANSNSNGESFLISNSRPITWKEFYNAYEKILGKSSTISLSQSEIAKIASKNRGSFKKEITQFIDIIRDIDFHDTMAKTPLVNKAYQPLIKYLPRDIKEKIRSRFFTNPDNNKNKPIEFNLWLPDNWKLKIYLSRATVKTDKARRILGFEPKYNFSQGIELTAKFLKWSNIL